MLKPWSTRGNSLVVNTHPRCLEARRDRLRGNEEDWGALFFSLKLRVKVIVVPRSQFRDLGIFRLNTGDDLVETTGSTEYLRSTT